MVTVTFTLEEAIGLTEAAKHGLDHAYVNPGVVQAAIDRIYEAMRASEKGEKA